MKKVVVLFILFISLYPICFILIGSFIGNFEVKTYLSALNDGSKSHDYQLFIFPKYLTLSAYVALLLDTPSFFVAFWNSFKSTILITVGQLLVNLPAAWWFYRVTFKGKNIIFNLYILLMVLPFVVLMVPQYMILKQMQLLDTLGAVILPGIFYTLAVFIITPYFRDIPKSVIEYAVLEGANEWQLFTKIALPFATKGIMIAIVLNFIDYWGSFESTMTYIKNKSLWNLPMYIMMLKVDNMTLIFFSVVVAMVVPIAILYSCREFLIGGLTIADK